MKPLFSIITPTHNRGYVIWKTIQSVQKQTYPDWELIIVDDGSIDDTEKVVAQFQKDPRIQYHKLPKGNANKARNYALTKAKGDFIAYLDSDDTLYNNFLSINLDYFTKYPKAIFALSNYNRRFELIDKNFKIVDFTDMSSAPDEPITLQSIFHWKEKGSGTGLVHKRTAIEKNLHWDESLTLFEDWDFKMQLGEAFPDGFLHIPYALFEYIQQFGGDGVCSNATYIQWAKGFERMYEKHKDALLMQGQTWYPDRVEKYKKMQEDFEAGKIDEPSVRYFPDSHKSKK